MDALSSSRRATSICWWTKRSTWPRRGEVLTRRIWRAHFKFRTHVAPSSRNPGQGGQFRFARSDKPDSFDWVGGGHTRELSVGRVRRLCPVAFSDCGVCSAFVTLERSRDAGGTVQGTPGVQNWGVLAICDVQNGVLALWERLWNAFGTALERLVGRLAGVQPICDVCNGTSLSGNGIG
jgi:hypothetical protein